MFGLIDECDRVSNSQVIGRAYYTYYATTNLNRKRCRGRRDLNKTKIKQHKEADLENREYNNQPPPGQVGL